MLIVSSGGVIGRYVAAVLGAGADAAIQLNLQTRNTGVTEIVRAGIRARAAGGVQRRRRTSSAATARTRSRTPDRNVAVSTDGSQLAGVACRLARPA